MPGKRPGRKQFHSLGAAGCPHSGPSGQGLALCLLTQGFCGPLRCWLASPLAPEVGAGYLPSMGASRGRDGFALLHFPSVVRTGPCTVSVDGVPLGRTALGAYSPDVAREPALPDFQERKARPACELQETRALPIWFPSKSHVPAP